MQLSPIQCTYSNIFIRFFKFSPENTNIYQNSYRVIGANCAVEIALSGRQCSLLCLFAPFPHGYTVSRGVPDNCAVEIALSGRQCSLLCLFAPFPHGYTVSRGVPDNCTFEITLLQAITLTLLLVCAFFSTQVQKYLAWVL